MNDKLKPCPFCGAHAKIETLFDDFYVEIFDGRATRAIYATKQEAIEAWNKRTQPTFTPDELDAIRRIFDERYPRGRKLPEIEQSIIDKCAKALKGGRNDTGNI